MLDFFATSRLSWHSLWIVFTGCNKKMGMWFPLDVVCLNHCNQQWLKVIDEALPSLLHVPPHADDILPGQEQFWQSFDISQPAWYWSTFLMWSHRQKSSSTSLTKMTFPVSGFFAGGPDIFWSLRLSQRCSGWSFKKWDMWNLFWYINVSKRGNPRRLVWRCTLMESEPQIFLKKCPKLSFFFFLDLSFSVRVCLMSELVHFCQTRAVQEQSRRMGLLCSYTSSLNHLLKLFVRQYKKAAEVRIVPKV